MKKFFPQQMTASRPKKILTTILCALAFLLMVPFTTRADSTSILVSPVVILQGAYNSPSGIVNMSTDLNTNNVIPLTQPYNSAPFSYAGTEGVSSIPAGITDWVLVDLRSADNSSTIIATRAAFLKNTDTVVDIDGVSPVSFSGVPAGSYFISVRHRNHLAVRSPSAISFTLGVVQYYNFTTAQSQAYQNPGLVSNNPAQAALPGGKFGLWGGDANQNASISYQGFANDRVSVLGSSGGNQATVLFPVYNAADVNMNGQLGYQGFANDRVAILGNAGGIQATIILQHL